jgi:hypothetical protein
VPEGWSLWWVIRATVAQVRDSYRRHRDSQRTPPVLVIVPRSPVGRAAKGPADSGRAA